MDHHSAKPTPAAIGTASFGTTRRHTTLTRTDCPFRACHARPKAEQNDALWSADPVRMQVVFGEALESDPVDLAGGVQRDLVEEHDLLRSLVAHPRPGELNQIGRASCRERV